MTTQEELMIQQYKDYYASLSTVDLISTITDGNVLNLSDKLSIPKFELQRYFTATNELLSRIQLSHSYHNESGEHVLTNTSYDITDLKAGIQSLKYLDLPDGDVVAKVVLGKYKAARQNPEVIF